MSVAGSWRVEFQNFHSAPRERSLPSLPPQRIPHPVPNGSPARNPPWRGGRVLTTFLCTVISHFKWGETIVSFSAFPAGCLWDPADSLSDNQGSGQPHSPGAPRRRVSEEPAPQLFPAHLNSVKRGALHLSPSQSPSRLVDPGHTFPAPLTPSSPPGCF